MPWQDMLPFNKQEKTDEEWEKEDERVSHEYSIEQKRAAIRQLKKRGVSANSFGNPLDPATWVRVFKWLKTH